MRHHGVCNNCRRHLLSAAGVWLAVVCMLGTSSLARAADQVVVVPVRQTAQLAVVKAVPELPVTTPPFIGDIILKFPVNLMLSAVNLPPPPPGPPGFRSVMGGSFLPTLLQQAVPHEGAALLAPDWLPGDEYHSRPAFAAFRLSATDYTGPPTVGLTWDHKQASDTTEHYIALANWQSEKWDWYEDDLDDVVTLASLEPYIGPDSQVFVLVVLLGRQQHTLFSVSLGAEETRGGGAVDAPLASSSLPPPLFPVGLPPQVDLSPLCAPIRHQGDWGACTAFALGDSAVNYELRRIYGQYGWDCSTARQKVSPAFLYVESGKGCSPTLGCGKDDFRCMPVVMEWLAKNGIALEADAPYLPSPCETDRWKATAESDAVLLRPARTEILGCNTDEALMHIKTLLAQGFVVPFETRVDQAFKTWQAGDAPWKFGGTELFGHAMCIVGYDETKQAFRVRNSWGTQWGDKGYMDMAYGSLEDPAAGAACYLVEMAEDPRVVKKLMGQTGETTRYIAPPTGVTATTGTLTDMVRVDWQTVPEAQSYLVFRDFTTSFLQEVTAPITHWKDKSGADGYCHTYWVRAVSDNLLSGLSASAEGYVLDLAAKPVIYGISYDDGGVGQQTQFALDYYSSSPATFVWSLGGCDPASSTSSSPACKFVTPGMQPLTVTVTNTAGSSTYKGAILIGPPGAPPAAALSASPMTGQGPLTVLLDASGCVESGQIMRYEWDWNGDGVYDYDSHGYSVILARFPTGAWNVGLRVWDGDDQAGTANVRVTALH